MKDMNVGKTKSKASTLYLVMTALLTAMTCVATLLIQIPVGIGYVNFGDAIIFISAVVLGPWGALIAGGVGSAMADLFTGFVVYAPFTLFIKGLSGLVVGFLFKNVFKFKSNYLKAALSFLIGALIVVVGYAFADFMLVLLGVIGGEGNLMGLAFLTGAMTIVPSLIQVGISFGIAMLVAPKLPTLSLMRKLETPKE